MFHNPSSRQLRLAGFGGRKRKKKKASKWPLQSTVYVPPNSPDLEMLISEGGVRPLLHAVDHWFVLGRDGGGARELLVSIEPKLARKIWGKNWKKWPFVLKRPAKTWIQQHHFGVGPDLIGFSEADVGRRVKGERDRKRRRYQDELSAYEDKVSNYEWFGYEHGPEWRSLLALPMGPLTLEEMQDQTGMDFEYSPHFFDGRGRGHWKNFYSGRISNPEAWERWVRDKTRLTNDLVDYITRMVSRMMRFPPNTRYKLLGDGTFASVFMILKGQGKNPGRGPYINDGKALKITGDPIDLISCAKIAKKNLPNVVYIEKVGWLRGIRFSEQRFLGREFASYMGFMIVQELLPLSKTEQWQHLGSTEQEINDALYNLYWLFQPTSSGSKIDSLKILGEIDNNIEEISRLESDSDGYVYWNYAEYDRDDLDEAVKMAEDIAKGIRQLRPYHIYPTDLHYGNVGYDPQSDSYKLIDIGLSKETLEGSPLPYAIHKASSEGSLKMI